MVIIVWKTKIVKEILRIKKERKKDKTEMEDCKMSTCLPLGNKLKRQQDMKSTA